MFRDHKTTCKLAHLELLRLEPPLLNGQMCNTTCKKKKNITYGGLQRY